MRADFQPLSLDSKDLLAHLKSHPDLIVQNMDYFRKELLDLNCSAPIISAFGAAVHNSIRENLRTAEYSKLILEPSDLRYTLLTG